MVTTDPPDATGEPYDKPPPDRSTPGSLPALLGEQAWTELSRGMERRTFQQGDQILAQGAFTPDFHIIESGLATVIASAPDGERRELGRLRPGDCAGEMALLTGDPASADVVASTQVVTYSATQQQLNEMADSRTRLIGALSTILAARLKSANKRLLQHHAANTIAICAAPDEVSPLSGLPAAIVRALGTPIRVVAVGDELSDAVRRISDGAENVTISALSRDDSVSTFLENVSRDHQHIVVFCDDATLLDPDVATGSVFHLASARGVRDAAGGHDCGGKTVIVGGAEAWTVPGLRRTSERLARETVAIIQADGAHDQMDRLARVLTGRRVGVAFGAGAAKGLAHLGVLRAFAEIGVPIDVVSGASIGAAVAAGVASGTALDELEQLVNRVAAKVVRPALPLHSLLSNAGIREEIKRVSGDTRIEDLDIPLGIVAVDMFRRAEVTFTSGPLWPPILASTAIPGVYPAAGALGSYLVDGGILTPVPARQCRALGADIVIGVRLTSTRTSPRERLDRPPGRPFAVEAMIRAFEIMQNRISEISHEPSDVTIEVRVEGTGGLRDFRRGLEFARLGNDAARAAIPDLAHALPYVKGASI